MRDLPAGSSEEHGSGGIKVNTVHVRRRSKVGGYVRSRGGGAGTEVGRRGGACGPAGGGGGWHSR